MGHRLPDWLDPGKTIYSVFNRCPYDDANHTPVGRTTRLLCRKPDTHSSAQGLDPWPGRNDHNLFYPDVLCVLHLSMVYDAFGAQPGTSLMGQSGFLTCSRERPCIKKIVDMFLISILRTGMKKIICFISPFHVETVVLLSKKRLDSCKSIDSQKKGNPNRCTV